MTRDEIQKWYDENPDRFWGRTQVGFLLSELDKMEERVKELEDLYSFQVNQERDLNEQLRQDFNNLIDEFNKLTDEFNKQNARLARTWIIYPSFGV